MMQTIVVDVVVALAALYLVWKFTPARLHARIAPPLARTALKLHVPAVLVRKLERKVATSGACGSCNSCNACATDPVEPTESGQRVIRIRSL